MPFVGQGLQGCNPFVRRWFCLLLPKQKQGQIIYEKAKNDRYKTIDIK